MLQKLLHRLPEARFLLSGLERFSAPARAGRGLLGTVRQVFESRDWHIPSHQMYFCVSTTGVSA